MPFPQLQGKCRGKTRKDGARSALFQTSCYFCCSVVICVVLCIVFICVVLCTVCISMCTVLYCTVLYCTVLLPQGVNPIAVHKYIIFVNAMEGCQLHSFDL